MLLSEETLLATSLFIYLCIYFLQNTSAVNFPTDISAASYQASVSNKHKYFHGSRPKASFMAMQHETSVTFFFFFLPFFQSWAIFPMPPFQMMSDL